MYVCVWPLSDLVPLLRLRTHIRTGQSVRETQTRQAIVNLCELLQKHINSAIHPQQSLNQVCNNEQETYCKRRKYHWRAWATRPLNAALKLG